MTPLERLYTRLGEPAWFYPVVIFAMLVVVPVLASAVEYAL